MSRTPPEIWLSRLRALGVVMGDVAWTPLTGGRTNPVWRGQGPGRDLALKLAGSGPATPLFPNDAQGEWHALLALAPTGLTPHPLHLLREAGQACLVYQHVQAAPGAEDLDLVLATLARLHRLSPWADLAPQPMTPASLIAACRAWAPDTAPSPPSRPDPTPVAPRPVHRDPVPGNVVATLDGVRLIDWQCPGLGDPVEDLVHLTSPMMRLVYGAAPLSPVDRQALIARYPDPAVRARYADLAPLYHWRLAVYGMWQVARGAAEYAPGIALELALSDQDR